MKEARIEWDHTIIPSDEDLLREPTANRISGWRLKRLLKRVGRDITTCECCHRKLGKRKLAVHHLDENPLNNKLENLLILCGDCHKKFHKDYEKLVVEGDK